MTSGSTQILKYLRSLPMEEEFSRLTISRALPDIGEGSISGFLSKLKSNGHILLTSRKPSASGHGSLEHYSIQDLTDVNTRKAKSQGGTVGRTVGGVPKVKRLAELLLSIAGDLEALPSPNSIRDFTTKELLKELERRTLENAPAPSSNAD